MDRQTGDALTAFGALAARGVDPTIQAGRYIFQAEAERRILPDVLGKLDVRAHHRVLDLGCGSGALAIPLSFLAAEVVAVDHVETVAALRRRFADERLKLVGGGFPDVALDGDFDRIVAYSVVVCLPDLDTVRAFILAAAALLRPGGRMLIGDMPNRDRQARFRAGAGGAEAEAAWDALKAGTAGSGDVTVATQTLANLNQIGGFTDAGLSDLMLTLRRAGYETQLLDQPCDLPFGRTREDILVHRA